MIQNTRKLSYSDALKCSVDVAQQAVKYKQLIVMLCSFPAFSSLWNEV